VRRGRTCVQQPQYLRYFCINDSPAVLISFSINFHLHHNFLLLLSLGSFACDDHKIWRMQGGLMNPRVYWKSSPWNCILNILWLGWGVTKNPISWLTSFANDPPFSRAYFWCVHTHLRNLLLEMEMKNCRNMKTFNFIYCSIIKKELNLKAIIKKHETDHIGI